MISQYRNITRLRNTPIQTTRIYGRENGFTLIELLVVVAIISLLVSILIPSLQKAKQLTRQVICQTRLKGIGSVYFLYMNDFNDHGPLGYTYGYNNSRSSGWSVWYPEDNPYRSGFGWYYPKTKDKNGNPCWGLAEYLGVNKNDQESKLPLSCASVPAEDYFLSHTSGTDYSVNAYLGYDTLLGDHVDAMASTPMIMDGLCPKPDDPSIDRYYVMCYPKNVFNWGGYTFHDYFLDIAEYSHKGSANYLFFDGHTENQKALNTLDDYVQLWTWKGH